jgi:hypothetical protein
MLRKAKIAGIAALAIFLAGSLVAAQQPPKIPRVGRLSPSNPSADAPMRAGLQQGLRDHGWVEGQNIVIEYRYGPAPHIPPVHPHPRRPGDRMSNPVGSVKGVGRCTRGNLGGTPIVPFAGKEDSGTGGRRRPERDGAWRT